MDDYRIDYKTLIEAIPDGYALHQIITDQDGDPVDYKYIDVNQAFLDLIGLDREGVINKSGSDLYKNCSESVFNWLEVFWQVAKTGESICFEGYFEAAGKYCEISVFRSAPGKFAAIYRSLSARNDREKALLE